MRSSRYTLCALIVLHTTRLGCGAAPSAGAGPESGATPVVELRRILARHRAALGGEAAIAKAARMSVRTSSNMYGLAAVTVETVDGPRYRGELRIPELPLEQIEVWDGHRLVVAGTNGDVRPGGPKDTGKLATSVAILSLSYLRPGSAAIEALPPITEDGQRFDRLLVREGAAGAGIELWLDAAGLVRRRVSRVDGTVTTTFVDEYGDYEGLKLPKRLRSKKSTQLTEIVYTVEKVDFSAQLAAGLFDPPLPRYDATFPPDRASITLPLGLVSERWIVVSGKLGDKQGIFLVDSGASSSVYDLDFVKSTGAKVKGEIAPAAGAFKGVSFVRAPALEVSDLRISPQTVLAIDLHGAGLPFRADGILGYDFLSRLDITLDYPAGLLTLAPPGSTRPEAGDLVVPFHLEGTSIRVPVRLNGRDAGMFELDTGNGGECTVHHVAGAAALVPSGDHVIRLPKGLKFGTGAAAAYLTHVDLSVGQGADGILWHDAPVRLLDPADPGASTVTGDGNLGYAWLKHLRITIDYAGSQIVLRQRIPFRPASSTGTFGASLSHQGGRVTVDDVAPGGPADRGGLVPGDEVLEADGVTTAAAREQSHRFLQGAIPGETRVLTIKRQGATRQVRLVAQPHP